VRPFNAFRLLLVIVMGLGSLLPAAGCGATKKPGLTIEQRLEKAEQEKTPDRQAAENEWRAKQARWLFERMRSPKQQREHPGMVVK